MLKVLAQFAKVVFLLSVMILLNPHRAILIPFTLLSVVGSWIAWRLEELCDWTKGRVDYCRVRFWIFGKSVNVKLDKEMAELHRRVAEVDKRLKEDGNV